MAIPAFEDDGDLPPGEHPATWGEIAARYDTNARRHALVHGLEAGLLNLQSAGCALALIDGSFVTAKERPGDFDVCWEAAGVDPAALDPVLLDFTNNRAAQKAKYGGEFFPTNAAATPAGTRYREFFQQDRGKPKGIITIDLTRFP